MKAKSASLFVSFYWDFVSTIQAHPLKLSLCQIEYASAEKTLTIELRLFLMDVNEALVFDPDNNELGLGQPDEAPSCRGHVVGLSQSHFYIKANGKQLALKIKKYEPKRTR